MTVPSLAARYLVFVLGASAGTLALLGMANWLIDPFGIHRPEQAWAGVPPEQWPLNQYARVHKPIRLAQVRPQTVIFGTSRAGIGLPAEDAGDEAYNMAVSGAGPGEIRRVLLHARSIGGYRRIVMTLDFPIALEAPDDQLADALMRTGVSGWRENLRVGIFGPLTLLLSHKTMQAACCGLQGSEARRLSRIGPSGREWPLDKESRRAELGDPLRYWREQEVPYARLWQQTRDLAPASRRALQERYGRELNALMAALESEPAVVQTVLLPVHPWHLLVMRAGGAWVEYSRWLLELVRTNPRIVVLDYGLASCAWTEAMTDSERWFVDPSHLSPEFGRAILTDLAGGRPPDCLGEPTKLHPSGVAEHLARIERRLDDYAASRPALYAAASELAREPQHMGPPQRLIPAWCRLWEKL